MRHAAPWRARARDAPLAGRRGAGTRRRDGYLAARERGHRHSQIVRRTRTLYTPTSWNVMSVSPVRSLQYFANWITPKPLPVRFDTRFFAATVPPRSRSDRRRLELVDALGGSDPPMRSSGPMPGNGTLRSRHARSSSSLVDSAPPLPSARTSNTNRMSPQSNRGLWCVDGRVEILMPDDSGFDEAAAGESDPALLSALEPIIRSGGERPPEVGSL